MEKIFDISEFVPTLTDQSVIAGIVQRVKRRRKELKYTQKELASRSGVSLGSVRRFERTGEISLASFVKIGRAINCLADFEQLFTTVQVTSLKEF